MNSVKSNLHHLTKRAHALTTTDTVVDQNDIEHAVLAVEFGLGCVRVVTFDRTLVYGRNDIVRLA